MESFEKFVETLSEGDACQNLERCNENWTWNKISCPISLKTFYFIIIIAIIIIIIIWILSR